MCGETKTTQDHQPVSDPYKFPWCPLTVPRKIICAMANFSINIFRAIAHNKFEEEVLP